MSEDQAGLKESDVTSVVSTPAEKPDVSAIPTPAEKPARKGGGLFGGGNKESAAAANSNGDKENPLNEAETVGGSWLDRWRRNWRKRREEDKNPDKAPEPNTNKASDVPKEPKELEGDKEESAPEKPSKTIGQGDGLSDTISGEELNDKTNGQVVEAPGNEVVESPKDKPISFPRTELLGEELTDGVISRSVDEYISWRRKNEYQEGVLEPGRADVLVHATSSDNALRILGTGELRSVYRNVIGGEEVRFDLMGGGKKRHFAGAAERLIRNDPSLVDLVMRPENRDRIFDYHDWIDDSNREDFRDDLYEPQDIDDYANVVRGFVEVGIENGAYRKEQKDWRGLSPWLYIANTLPKELQARIAEEAGAEKYVSFALGHAIEDYTGAVKAPDKQSAVIVESISEQGALTLDVDNYPLKDLYTGGGRGPLNHLRESELEERRDRLRNQKSELNTTEYSGALEVSVFDDEDKGTAIDLRSKGAVMLLPESARNKVSDMDSENAGRVIFFDDTKFRNINEAFGWVMTTPEGRKLYDLAKSGRVLETQSDVNRDSPSDSTSTNK